MESTNPTCLTELPTEVIVRIMVHLDCQSIGRLSSTSKRLYHISRDIDNIWEEIALKDYGISLDYDECSTAFDFYCKVLRPYGRCLGLWQRQNLAHYGGLLQVAYEKRQLNFYDLLPPSRMDVTAPLLRKDFFTMKLEGNRIVYNMIDQFIGTNDLTIVVQETGKGMSIYPHDCPDFTESPQLWQNFLNEFVRQVTGQDVDRNMHSHHIMKFLNLFHSRSMYNYKPMKLPRDTQEGDFPIRPGLFKGTYGSHGIEIIKVAYPSDDKLEAIKVTGDPNVPFRETTFTVDLNASLSIETINQYQTHDLMDVPLVFTPFKELERTRQVQPFMVPVDCHQDAPIPYQQCKFRFFGKGQIAGHGHMSPEFIPVHFVVFDEDSFAVLFLGLHSVSMFKRIKQNVSSKHVKDF